MKKEDDSHGRVLSEFEYIQLKTHSKTFRFAIAALVVYLLGSEFIKILPSFAGQETAVTVSIIAQALFSFKYIISYGAGAAGVVYGLRERKLARRKVNDVSEHIKDLEKRIHPDRSSSNLTSAGTTNPGDEM